MHIRLVNRYLLNVPSVSSPYFNKTKRTSRLGKWHALSLEILSYVIQTLNRIHINVGTGKHFSCNLYSHLEWLVHGKLEILPYKYLNKQMTVTFWGLG